MAHDHSHHDHHHRTEKPRAVIGRSLLLMGVGPRLLIAGGLAALIWLMVLGAMA